MGAGAVLSAFGDAAKDVFNGVMTYQNYLEQKNVNRWNQENQIEAWARDDTSRQRMVKDLEQAGLSKWLASGASPMTSSPIQLGAPQMGKVDLDAMQHAYDNYITERQTQNQTDAMNSQKAVNDASIAVKEAEKEILEQKKRVAKHDADIIERRDTASTDPALLKYVSEAINTLKGTNEAGQKLRSVLPGTKQFYDKVEQKRYEKKVEKAHNKYMKKVESVEEAKRKDKGDSFKPLSYTDWLRMNQLPANSGTVQSYKSYAERR